ncbi:hypothetical protein PVAP13_4NG286338 [Panicum virgatum]|uniref:Uncharacterized protein n=1 Tax=Panicum virgatum TaxID=38727 RepID=A0A8T0TAV2_PANVG|nr:hypothetical protein PVAP13_4NG286338 [Panicum virgatum]
MRAACAQRVGRRPWHGGVRSSLRRGAASACMCSSGSRGASRGRQRRYVGACARTAQGGGCSARLGARARGACVRGWARSARRACGREEKQEEGEGMRREKKKRKRGKENEEKEKGRERERARRQDSRSAVARGLQAAERRGMGRRRGKSWRGTVGGKRFCKSTSGLEGDLLWIEKRERYMGAGQSSPLCTPSVPPPSWSLWRDCSDRRWCRCPKVAPSLSASAPPPVNADAVPGESRCAAARLPCRWFFPSGISLPLSPPVMAKFRSEAAAPSPFFGLR